MTYGSSPATDASLRPRLLLLSGVPGRLSSPDALPESQRWGRGVSREPPQTQCAMRTRSHCWDRDALSGGTRQGVGRVPGRPNRADSTGDAFKAGVPTTDAAPAPPAPAPPPPDRRLAGPWTSPPTLVVVPAPAPAPAPAPTLDTSTGADPARKGLARSRPTNCEVDTAGGPAAVPAPPTPLPPPARGGRLPGAVPAKVPEEDRGGRAAGGCG
jgi:hypothetical protein